MATGTITSGATVDDGPAAPAELIIETEALDASMASETKPDRTWTHVDPRGHFHAWSDDETLPTLSAKTEHVDCGDPDCGCGGEGYDITVYECSICGASVKPGTTTTGPMHRMIPGRTTWRVWVDADVVPDLVTVRVEESEGEAFGVAHPVRHVYESGRARTQLVGVGPLGRRKRL